MVTYEQYIIRLIEWTEDYLDYIAARIEYDDLLSHGFSLEESFEMVKSFREPPEKQSWTKR